MKHGTSLLIIMIVAFSASAQKDTSGVVVHKDPRIDQLVKKHIEYNEVITRESRRYVQGFRILVMSTNDRNKVNEAKTKLYTEFPEYKSYLTWQSPSFRLKVGDFKTRPEAEEALAEIKRFFPSGVYIVHDTIEVNPDRSDKSGKSESREDGK